MMQPGFKFHVEYAVGSTAKEFSGFFVGLEANAVAVFENRTSAYTEEMRITTDKIVSVRSYNEKAPWLK